jgi:hypothetical protein
MNYRLDISNFSVESSCIDVNENNIVLTAYPTKAGVFTYREGDKVINELRPESEVFKSDSMDTLKMKPLSEMHNGAQLSFDNVAKNIKGYTGEKIEVEGDKLKCNVAIFDKETIKKVLSKELVQLSTGYQCDFINQPGIYKGKKYDRIQKNIVYNHISCVDKGRAGDCEFKLDSDKGFLISFDHEEKECVMTEQQTRIKIDSVNIDELKLDAVDVIESDGVEKLISQRDELIKFATSLNATLKNELSKKEAKIDSLTTQLNDEIEKAQDTEKLDGMIEDRLVISEMMELKQIKLDREGSFEAVNKKGKAVLLKEKNYDAAKLDNDEAYFAAAWDQNKNSIKDERARAKSALNLRAHKKDNSFNDTNYLSKKITI